MADLMTGPLSLIECKRQWRWRLIPVLLMVLVAILAIDIGLLFW
jgi:uncharacterized membrane protein